MERRATKSWVWARARAEERVPMCRVRFVCKSKELGGGGASWLVRVGGADGIFCSVLGWGGFAEWGGDAGLAEGADYGRRGHFISKREHWYRGPEMYLRCLYN